MKNNVNYIDAIDWRKYFVSVVCFLLLINMMFFLQGAFFSPVGYSFDIQRHIFSVLPIALIAGAFGIGADKMGF